jgi:hypothetical protein
MKNLFARLAQAAVLGSLLLPIQQALAQGTVFTYQGQLAQNGLPANGNYDFVFMLYANNNTNTGPALGAVTNLDVGVTNGLFTVTLDFGSVFTGNATWLAIVVQTNGGGNFTALSPLQELTPAPYAIFANTARNLIAPISINLLPGFQGADNAVDGGSGNVFLGAASCSAMGGGSDNTYWGLAGTIGGGFENEIMGGGGPEFNGYGTIGGGLGNIIAAATEYGTIAGGGGNMVAFDSYFTTIGGGLYNLAADDYATVPGGYSNIASGEFSFAAGQQAQAGWNYKTDRADRKHIGPMAQDFHDAFQLDGDDDKHISVVDEGGVALSAIQGLNQKLNEKEAEIQDLKQSVTDLKKQVQSLAEKK